MKDLAPLAAPLAVFAAVALLTLAGPNSLSAGLTPGACDAGTVVTLVGVDTAARSALLHLAEPGSDRPPALLEVAADGSLAWLHRPGRRPFGGSVGPGPVLAFERCGESCLQVFRWRDWAWQPVGEPLEVPAAATVHATWDRSGAPWVVMLGETATRRRLRAWAWRFSGDGEAARWYRHGPLTVEAVGEPAAVPDETAADAVRVGSGLFPAGELAHSWLAGLPRLEPERQAEVEPLDGDDRALVTTGDGAWLITRDGGESWQWGPADQPPMEGEEPLLDRPTGDRSGPPPVIWVDHRAPRPAVILGHRTADGSFELLTRLPIEVVVPQRATLTFEHFLRLGDEWWLLTGCVDTPEASGLVVRGPAAERDGLAEPRFVSIATP